MKVSVIIAVYNEAKHVGECLEGLRTQTLKNLEIIVVDDGSTDKTWQVLSGIKDQTRLPDGQGLKIRKFKQRHEGPARARNFGARQANGEILVFVDADMYFEESFIEDLVFPIKKGKAKGTFSTNELVANWENKWARCWNYNWNLPDKRRIDPKRADQQKDFRAIRKREFDKIGGFDNIGYTDTWSLASKLGYQPLATKALYYHYNPASLSEIFKQAKWVAKRKYKFGLLGTLLTLFRTNAFFSLLNGFKRAISKKEPAFLIFKLVFDFGITCGLWEWFFRKKIYA